MASDIGPKLINQIEVFFSSNEIFIDDEVFSEIPNKRLGLLA